MPLGAGGTILYSWNTYALTFLVYKNSLLMFLLAFSTV